MNIVGKTRQQIEEATRKLKRKQLIALLHQHVTIEPKFTPEQIAQANRLTPRVVRKLMRAGTLPAHEPVVNQLRSSLSQIRSWDENTALTLSDRAG